MRLAARPTSSRPFGEPPPLPLARRVGGASRLAPAVLRTGGAANRRRCGRGGPPFAVRCGRAPAAAAAAAGSGSAGEKPRRAMA